MLHALLLAGALAAQFAAGLQGPPAAPPAPAATPPADSAHGTSAPEITEPVLDDLLRRARERSPRLAAARARGEAARLRIEPGASLPDPSLTLRLDDAGFPRYTVGSDDFSILSLDVQQGLSNPRKRRAAREVGRASAELQATDLLTLERRIEAQVRTLFARLYAIDQEIAVRLAAKELLDLLKETASSRYATGSTGLEGLARAQLESLHASARLEELGSTRAGLVSALNRDLDLPAGTPIGAVTELPEPPALPLGTAFQAQANAPALVAARAAVRAAERRLDAARLSGRPDYTAGGAFGYRGGFDPVVTLRLGVELPLRRRQKQEVLAVAAERELEAARADLRAAEAEIQAEVARLDAAWRTDDRILVHDREGLLPQTSLLLDASRTSYLTGRGDFAAVIEAYDFWIEARLEILRHEADRFADRAELAALVAPLPAPVDPPTSVEGTQP
jgi:outer membrane protein TolC